MKYTKTITLLLSTMALSTLISGCAKEQTIPPSQGGYSYRGIYFGQVVNASYRLGIQDGCETARGFYTKSHFRFNQDPNYHEGWFLGRNKCRGLLRIDKNGDLIK